VRSVSKAAGPGSIASALVSRWFYERWLGAGEERLESLRWATQRLRTASRAECEQALGRRIYKRGERLLADEFYWGAFVLYG
jgi:CHAT domain-containing protein